MAGARKPKHIRRITRGVPQRNPRKLIVVVCEGTKTEPQYLQGFTRSKASAIIAVKLIPLGQDPSRIVSRAVAEKKDQTRKAKISGNSFDENFEIWGVFDVDDHRTLPAAKDTAQANGIKLAISNPCFEVWGLFHFEPHAAPDDRQAVYRKLQAHLPSFDPRNNKQLLFEDLEHSLNDAKQNARNSLTAREREGNPNGNPSSQFHELLESIEDDSS